MPYDFEALGDERFQELCQALLAIEYPGIQCLPVNQPDGGRDALKRLDESSIVFQVKFARSQLRAEEAREWLLKQFEHENSKVKELIRRGATRYILVTNVEGSAHLDGGLVDTVSAKMKTLFGIETQCLFRADLSRRLDSNWDIKCTYPEILSGIDNFRSLLETFGASQVDTLKALLTAFVTAQYRQDYRVKFKQIGLENRLLDLFTDTPFQVVKHQQYFDVHSIPREWGGLLRVELDDDKVSLVSSDHYMGGGLGVASFLLNSFTKGLFPRLVIEGAPGQGKSTLAQYLSQLHRMRWLKIKEDCSSVAAEHLTSRLRIPIKVDLRDLAVWLTGIEPFHAERKAVTGVDLSLETFLARLLQHASGGHPCSVADLVAIAERTPLLLVLDGLDEVADPKIRILVVDQVTEGIARLEGFCPDLQTLITSRPSIFANSPGFDLAEFPHLTLTALNRPQVRKYATRWMSARQIPEGDRTSFMEVLEQRLEQPHLRDLARNPMQLAILLELIRTKGVALPDKRTSLYDQYVALFFDREAEKSDVVRDSREELLQVHGYLAWKLHSSAEEGRAEGRMEIGTVKNEVRQYLEREKHSVDAIEELFTALVERVVMLVSRIQGSFEFEVQPLREYFAGRFLYETAPPSRPGFERSDTKIDRFDVIARNPYWSNVTRFFSGMFGKGELIDLADRVTALGKDEELAKLRLPTDLASQLLSDWVFAQTPRAVDEVARNISTEAGLIWLCSGDTFQSNEILALSEKCGRALVAQGARDLIIRIMQERPDAIEWARLLAQVVARNADPIDLQIWWNTDLRKACGDEVVVWHVLGLISSATNALSKEKVVALVKGTPQFREVVVDYTLHGRMDVVSFDVETESVAEAMLLDTGDYWHDPNGPVWLRMLSSIMQAISFNDDVDEVVQNISEIVFSEDAGDLQSGFQVGDTGPRKSVGRMVELLKAALRTPEAEVDPIEFILSYVDSAVDIWGVRRNIAAQAVKWIKHLDIGLVESEPPSIEPVLLSAGALLTERLSEAKAFAGDPRYWEKIAERCSRTNQRHLALMAFLAFASPENIVKYGPRICPPDDTDRLWEWAEGLYSERVDEAGAVDILVGALGQLPTMACFSCAIRFVALYSRREFIDRIKAVKPSDWHVGYRLNNWAVDWVANEQIEWTEFLGIIKRNMKLVGLYPHSVQTLKKIMPVIIAEQIVGEGMRWPPGLVEVAEHVLDNGYRTKVVPVAFTARAEKWSST